MRYKKPSREEIGAMKEENKKLKGEHDFFKNMMQRTEVDKGPYSSLNYVLCQKPRNF